MIGVDRSSAESLKQSSNSKIDESRGSSASTLLSIERLKTHM